MNKEKLRKMRFVLISSGSVAGRYGERGSIPSERVLGFAGCANDPDEQVMPCFMGGAIPQHSLSSLCSATVLRGGENILDEMLLTTEIRPTCVENAVEIFVHAPLSRLTALAETLLAEPSAADLMHIERRLRRHKYIVIEDGKLIHEAATV